ncbi:MAG: Gfo/Idh/MocA family oxidoreductase [Ferruginibacter sp.]
MKKIKTALCSFGMSGKVFHAPFIHLHEGYEFYAVCERSRKEAALLYPGIRSFDSFEQLLEDPAIELLIINTPNATHFDFARRALQAGKHIVVEKPFCSTVAEADELIRLSAEKNCSMAVYQNRRWDSDFTTVQKIIQEEWLGELLEAEFHFDRYNQQLSPKLFKEIPGPGAGLLYDLGSHLIDQALCLFGFPKALFADLVRQRPASQVEDYMEILLYYDKLRVRLKAGYQVREAVPAYVVHGSQGSFLKPRADVQEAMLKEGARPGTPDWGTEPAAAAGLLHTERAGEIIRKTVAAEKGDYGAFYASLFDALAGKAPVPVSAQEARQVIALIEAAFKSNEQKRVIVFNE